LSAHLGDSQAKGCCRGGLRGGKHSGLPLFALSGDKISVVPVWQPKPYLFYLRTNNATK